MHNGLSQRAAAKKHGITQSTLSRRVRGPLTKRKSKVLTQRLFPSQERFICKRISDEDKAGRAPSRPQVVGFVTSILKRAGDHDKLGPQWIDLFINRNPEVGTKISSSLGSARARGSTKGSVTTSDLLGDQIGDNALDDSDAMINDDALPPSPAIKPPRTPPRVEDSEDEIIFNTPKTGRDVMEAIQDELPNMDPHLAMVFIKTAKALDIQNAKVAALERQIQYPEARLELQGAREP
ncbi:hypothetical protein SMACR_04440 [Sordaria macrospora]|nr:hypothetical protein SMACR_04440 [Sordaria macrospora]WPJ59908.1 hypothetical protein SMAC4_04440 [Sordaria macrospora]